MQKKVDEYFTVSGSLKSMTGLALYLGFADRQSLHDYEKREPFSFTIKQARTRVEKFYEEQLTVSRNPSGSIFALKNFGWSDRQEVEHSGTIDNIIRFPLKTPIGSTIDALDSNRPTGAGSQSPGA
jgi:hypothetical protein